MSKLVGKIWKYADEKADYDYYRKKDKETPDSQVLQQLEMIHKWYPDKTLAQLQGRDDELKNRFLAFFPQADMHQFTVIDHPDTGANVFFGAWAIFGDTPKDENKLENPRVVKALGLSSSFPVSLQQTGANYSLPKINGKSGKSVKGKSIDTDIRIFSSPGNSFVINFRNIFTDQSLKFTSAEECNKWAASPNYKYWPQQLNLAVWCATGGCGVSTDWSGLPLMVKSLLQFHIYFTVRRLLWEMGVALPGDSAFNAINNPYDKPAVYRIIAEFGLHSPDFRWIRGDNRGLGSVYSTWNVYHTKKLVKMTHDSFHAQYGVWPGGISKFSDEASGKVKIKTDGFFGMFKEYSGDDTNLITFIRNDESADQASWYTLDHSYGLTRAGVGRLNRSIEAFVYCVLGAQVNMRGSIVGDGGIAQNVRQELTDLFEKAIIEENLSESVKRYQEAIQNSGVKLDFAISPGAWLLPSKLEINLDRKEGYNNFLQKASDSMKLGVNSGVNVKIAETHETPEKPETHKVETEDTFKPENHTESPKPPTNPSKIAEIHNDTLATIAIMVAGTAWWVFR